jgi:ParB family transcriptional regulator, chromosome partitioning protein
MATSKYHVEQVPLVNVRVSGKNTRAVVEDDEIDDLAQSIAQKGLLQPVGVRADANGMYRLLWGERRYRAHKRLRRSTITCHVYPENGVPDEALMAVENLLRQNHTLAEECAWVRALQEQDNMSVEGISSLLNRSRSWVLARLSVQSMGEHLREPLLAGDISLRVVEEIARLGDEPTEKYILSQALQNRLSASGVKQLVRAHQASPHIEQAAEVGRQMAAGNIPVAPVLVSCTVCERRIPVQNMEVVYVCRDRIDCQQENERTSDARANDEGLNGNS